MDKTRLNFESKIILSGAFGLGFEWANHNKSWTRDRLLFTWFSLDLSPGKPENTIQLRMVHIWCIWKSNSLILINSMFQYFIKALPLEMRSGMDSLRQDSDKWRRYLKSPASQNIMCLKGDLNNILRSAKFELFSTFILKLYTLLEKLLRWSWSSNKQLLRPQSSRMHKHYSSRVSAHKFAIQAALWVGPLPPGKGPWQGSLSSPAVCKWAPGFQQLLLCQRGHQLACLKFYHQHGSK